MFYSSKRFTVEAFPYDGTDRGRAAFAEWLGRDGLHKMAYDGHEFYAVNECGVLALPEGYMVVKMGDFLFPLSPEDFDTLFQKEKTDDPT